MDSKFMHAKIKDVSGKKIKCSSPGCIKPKDGTMLILMEKMEILNRWSEYVEDLFRDDRCEKPKIKNNIEGPTILKEEVEAAIKKMKMKNGKATGPDNIPVEIIKALDNLGIDLTTKLLNAIYDSGTIPEDLCKFVFILLPKTPGATECELHRTISLMSHFKKILLRVLMHRTRKSLRPEISPKQFGFMPDKGTRNAIFTLSMLMERCIKMQKDLHLCFIDYSKAFDKVRHVELFRILEKLDIDGKDLIVIRNIFWDQTASVRISDFKPIKRGVKQGCVMSPDLFNLYNEIILRNLDDISGLKINRENLNNLRYADDTVIIAESGKQLQKLLDTVVLESERMGLSLNVKKTECMVISKKSSNPKCNLVSKGEKNQTSYKIQISRLPDNIRWQMHK
ncbi:endonuclease-reverse transcriptase [Plakobranchus ocellatus]|uniref:Endonuclease-reverse transcriptase n=1 Tax=Plakobranchus ocellatus TaxID=259542 RepID=A0AAV3ZE17_9GAST|nr:endonuclease-reverse transcriptase [Plakobranchus ocellatus]